LGWNVVVYQIVSWTGAANSTFLTILRESVLHDDFLAGMPSPRQALAVVFFGDGVVLSGIAVGFKL